MNMQSIMQQAQRMQRDLQKKKDEISGQLFPGKYEFVEVTLNGKKEMVSCKINKEELAKEDIEMLQDMIMIATNEAMKKVDQMTEQKMGKFSSAMPGLF